MLENNCTLISTDENTNRSDKNSKEIYENDNLSYCYHVQPQDTHFKGIVLYDVRVLEIGWEHDETLFVGFILRCDNEDGTFHYIPIPNIPDIEVISNIYENPELLEE